MILKKINENKYYKNNNSAKESEKSENKYKT